VKLKRDFPAPSVPCESMLDGSLELLRTKVLLGGAFGVYAT
jgi:hypothetical protein